MPRRGVRRGAGTGATTASARGPSTTRTAARRPSSASSTPATRAGLGVCLDVVYNHLGPVGQLPVAASGPTSPTPTRRRGARRSTSTAPTADEVRRWIVDNALRWFARLPRRRPAPRRRARAARRLGQHVLAAAADEVAALARRLGRPLRPHRRERPQRPASWSRPTAEGGRGMDAQWDDDVHHALHVALTGETPGLLRRLRRALPALPDGGPLAVLAKTLTRAFLHDGTLVDLPRRGLGRAGRPRRASTGAGSWPTCRPTTRWATAPSATASRAIVTPGRQAVGAALYLISAVHPDGLHGRGVGGDDAVPVLHRLRATRPWPGRAPRVGGASSRPTAGPPTTCPTRRTSRPSALQAATGTSWRLTDHARMLAWYRDLIALRRSHARPHRRPTRRGARRLRRATSSGSSCAGAPAHRVVNLAASRWTVPLDAEPSEVVLAWEPSPTRAGVPRGHSTGPAAHGCGGQGRLTGLRVRRGPCPPGRPSRRARRPARTSGRSPRPRPPEADGDCWA